MYVYVEPGPKCLEVMTRLKAMLVTISSNFYGDSFAPSFHLCRPGIDKTYYLGTNIESLPDDIPGTGRGGGFVSKTTVLEWLGGETAATVTPAAPAICRDQTTPAVPGISIDIDTHRCLPWRRRVEEIVANHQGRLRNVCGHGHHSNQPQRDPARADGHR